MARVRGTAIGLGVLVSALVFVLLSQTSGASAQTANPPLVVNGTGDGGDSERADGICLAADGTCTLRAAIEQANYNRGADRIHFAVPGSGLHQLIVATALPSLNDPSGGTTIDGYTQSGSTPNGDALVFNAVITIEVEGTIGHNVFTIESAENSIRGLAIYAGDVNVELLNEGADGNRVIGNIIGTDTTAAYQRASGVGVLLNTGPDQNTIGTPDPADRNVISGNGGQGIRVNHGETSRNVIQNNIIGLDPSGTVGLNQAIGIDLQWWTWGNLVGGLGPGEANLIGGHRSSGVDFSHMATGNVVAGNRIGTTPDGTGATSETGNKYGLIVKDDPTGNYAVGNIIAGNDSDGIWHKHNYTARNYFIENKIGVGSDGSPVGNGGWGAYVTGHDDLYYGNIVANNLKGGVNINNTSSRNNANSPDELTERNTVEFGTFYNNGGPHLMIETDAHPNAAKPRVTGLGPGEVYGDGACAGCTVQFYVSGSVEADGSVSAGPSSAAGIVLRAQHSGDCVDVAGVSFDDGANIHQWQCHTETGLTHQNQEFEVVPSGAGFALRAAHSGLCLELAGSSLSSGANVEQGSCTGAANQSLQWAGKSLVFAHSGKCLDVQNGGTSDGTNLIQATCRGYGSQRFYTSAKTPTVSVGSVTADEAGAFSMASTELVDGVVVSAVTISPSGESSEFSGHLMVGPIGFGLAGNPGTPSPGGGAPPTPAPPAPYQPVLFECAASDGVLSWDDEAAVEYYVFATVAGQESYLGPQTGTSLVVAAADEYRVTHWRLGYPRTASCVGPGVVADDPFDCSADGGVLSWDDAGAAGYYVFATVAGQESYLGGHSGTSLVVAAADEYRVTHWFGGRTVATCAGPGVVADDPFGCSTAEGVLSWDDAGAAEYYVFATTAGVDTYLGGHSGTSLVVAAADEYRVTHWLGGRTVATCDPSG